MEKKIIDVLLPLPFDQTFKYASLEKNIELGSFVLIPFKNKTLVGCVWENRSTTEKKLPLSKIKYIKEKLNYPLLTKVNRDFLTWVADYTMNNLGQILKLCLSVKNVFNKKKKINFEKNIKVFQNGQKLTKEQANAKKIIFKKIDRKEFTPIVIDGVAGSGKTEVYFEAIYRVMKEKKQVLVLLPEISMTTQWFDRFQERFKIKPKIWHSDVKSKEKVKIWNSIINGHNHVIVGARSALFLPFKNLGLIILDEEHDQSFKQEEGVIYNARDMAVLRAKKTNIPIILCSATLSLETQQNIIEKKYDVVELKEKYGKAGLPQIKIIDLIEKPPEKHCWLSREVHIELEKTLKSSNQALIFLNRRGFAPYVFCNKCGNKLNCPNCDVGFVYHKKLDSLVCHHCGVKTFMPKKNSICKICNKETDYNLYGPGVERILEEIKSKHRNYNAEILTSDVMSKKEKGQEIIRNFEKEEIKILIGTQILAKGHHFPKLTLVVVVDSDIGFFGGDLRATEKTFQLLMQVIGRSGRSKIKGKVLIQTTMAENVIFKNIINYNLKEFYNEELDIRKNSGLPPFKKLCSIMFTSDNEKKLENFCNDVKRKKQVSKDFEVLGPAPPYISYLRGKFRRRFIIRYQRKKNIQKFVSKWILSIKNPYGIKTYIDIDPYNFS